MVRAFRWCSTGIFNWIESQDLEKAKGIVKTVQETESDESEISNPLNQFAKKRLLIQSGFGQGVGVKRSPNTSSLL